MKQNIIAGIAVLALILSTLALVGGNQSVPSNTTLGGGGVTNYDNLTLATSNTSTSTFSGGCIQTVATSTASPIVLAYGTSFTSTTTLPSGVAVSSGLVAWKFGTCPL